MQLAGILAGRGSGRLPAAAAMVELAALALFWIASAFGKGRRDTGARVRPTRSPR
ncbi:hypothetical protein [Spongiactinospora sp. 9N601]|uniref:hypothetical protein n=1 Tax=Spongiactinospora sp. 9N601 TaxID=3375149 RepID=UPI00378A6F8A